MKKIIIASKNPVKINATRVGFRKMFAGEIFKIEAVRVPFKISKQPKTDSETFRGAVSRQENARKIKTDADFWVGIEGGVEEKNNTMEAFAWVIIRSKDGRIGKGKTGTFFLPVKVRELIKKGKELGEADDIVFSRTNSKQKNGAVGILTNNVIDRTEYYTQAIILALIPFKNKNLY